MTYSVTPCLDQAKAAGNATRGKVPEKRPKDQGISGSECTIRRSEHWPNARRMLPIKELVERGTLAIPARF